MYSTYLGGNAIDNAYSVDLDGSGIAYVTGLPQSSNCLIVNGFDSTCGGCKCLQRGLRNPKSR